MKTSYPHIVHLKEEREAMLKKLGIKSIEELYVDIPRDVLLKRKLALPEPLSEYELGDHLRKLAKKNINSHEYLNFIGAGIYDIYIPPVIDTLTNRGEILTSYTPYQAEISQGILQMLAEFQKTMRRVLGMPVATCSSYDGAIALADAAWMGYQEQSKKGEVTLLIAESIWPHYKEVLSLYLHNAREISNDKIKTIRVDEDSGEIDLEHLSQSLSQEENCVFIFQSSNAYGVIENLQAIVQLCQQHKAISVLCYQPLLGGIFINPGKLGIEIATFEGQVFGLPMAFGGASLGILGCQKKYINLLPGRLVGNVKDIEGESVYALISQEREQHVARADATSNICSNQTLYAIRALMYLSLLGDTGLRALSKINFNRAHYLANKLTEIKGVKLRYSGCFMNEFVVTLPVSVEGVLKEMEKSGIFGGLAIGKNGANQLLIAVTENKSPADLDRYVTQMKTILSK